MAALLVVMFVVFVAIGVPISFALGGFLCRYPFLGYDS